MGWNDSKSILGSALIFTGFLLLLDWSSPGGIGNVSPTQTFVTSSPSVAYVNSKTGCKVVLKRKPTTLQASKDSKVNDEAREKAAKYAIAGLLSLVASSNQQAAASEARVAELMKEWNKEYGAQYGQWDMTVYDFGGKAVPAATALNAPSIKIPKKPRTTLDPVSQVMAEWNKDFAAEYGVWEPVLVPVQPAVLSKPLADLTVGLAQPLVDTLVALEPQAKPTIMPVALAPASKPSATVLTSGPAAPTSTVAANPVLTVTDALEARSNFFRDLVVPLMVAAYMFSLMAFAVYHYGQRWYSRMAMTAIGQLEPRTATENGGAEKKMPTIIQMPSQAPVKEEPVRLQKDILVKSEAVQNVPAVEILPTIAEKKAPSLPVKAQRQELQTPSVEAWAEDSWAAGRSSFGDSDDFYKPVECGIDRVATALLESQLAQRELTPMSVILDLQRGNCRFWMGLSDTPLLTPVERRALILSQAPKVCILSCSDSRVPVELVFDQGLGEVFVVRTAGNTLDTTAQGSIEFAVKHLGVKAVIVMGHEGCGAVQGAINLSEDMIAREPSDLAAVLGGIRSGVDVEELKHISDAWSREREAIVWNTTNHVKTLQRNPVLREGVSDGSLLVCGAYYHVSSGIVDFFSLDKNGFVTDVLA
eukprot:EG_transcript_4391